MATKALPSTKRNEATASQPKDAPQQYVLLPPRGLRASSIDVSSMLLEMEGVRGARRATSVRAPGAQSSVRVRVIDSVHEDGAKLVELSAQAVSALRAAQPSIRVVPVVYFRPANRPVVKVLSSPRSANARVRPAMRIRVESSQGGGAIEGAHVVAFTDFTSRVGAESDTDANGDALLDLGSASVAIDRIYVFPKRGFWSRLRRRLTLRNGDVLKLQPLEPGHRDARQHFHPAMPPGTGAGVTVGIVDTGVDGSHADLLVDGGLNTVQGESPADFGDNGAFHGTHVAGIVASRGSPPGGMQGLAPSVRLRSYRVFGRGSDNGSNFAILKAIDQAVADGCDLINMSLGGPVPDEATREAIEDARVQGVVVIAAAGNDDRSPVSYPAANSQAVGVSAVGRRGTFPRGTSEWADIAAPFGTDPLNFLAAFSNVGAEIDLADAGVGIVSTVPGGHAAMSGTSMACPAVTGIAARLLGGRPDVLAMPRDEARSTAIVQMLLTSGTLLGLGAVNEGQGLPNV